MGGEDLRAAVRFERLECERFSGSVCLVMQNYACSLTIVSLITLSYTDSHRSVFSMGCSTLNVSEKKRLVRHSTALVQCTAWQRKEINCTRAVEKARRSISPGVSMSSSVTRISLVLPFFNRISCVHSFFRSSSPSRGGIVSSFLPSSRSHIVGLTSRACIQRPRGTRTASRTRRCGSRGRSRASTRGCRRRRRIRSLS